MGIAYCAIKYEFAGKLYEAVHTLHRGDTFPTNENTFTEADAIAWGFQDLGTGDLNARIDTSNPGDYNPLSVIEHILGFHRAVQGPLVRLKQVYLNDGFTLGTATGNFATFDLDLACQCDRLGTTLTAYAPANNTLMLDKASAVFSRRGGRMFLRGALALGEISASAEDGVMLATAQRAAVVATVLDAQNQADIDNGYTLSSYFGSGIIPPIGPTLVQYGVGKTKEVTVDGKPRRILDSFTRVAIISVDDAQSRDTRRRNKKAVGSS